LIIDESSGNDTLSMTNIDKDALSFSRNDDDLQIAVADGGIITLKNYFNDINAGVQTLYTAQGAINLSKDVVHFDWLRGSEDDDLLIGSNVVDRLYGGEGDDNLYGGEGKDYLYGGNGDDALIGASGNDRLYGYGGDDFLSGGSGRDRLYGAQGSDTLIGRSGDDYLEGYYGSDTYIFNQGDGHDTIAEWSKEGSSDFDVLQFGEGITQENLTILRDGYDAIFKIDADNSVRVKGWFDDDNRSVLEQIQFADNTTLSIEDVNSLAIVEGTNRNNRLYGMNKLNDNLFGLGGNDRLYGYEGDDFLSGGSGRDRLYGAQGSDTFIGGTGDDYLEGYYGSDTYIFNQGDGHDTIAEWSEEGSSDIDTIKFGTEITKDDVSFTFENNDLLIQYGADDLIKVNNVNNTRGQIERIELSDGMYITNDDINFIIQQVNAYGEEKGMEHISNNDIQNNHELMNIVSSAWHK